MMTSISTAILHSAWRPERARALKEMLEGLGAQGPAAAVFSGQKSARMAWAEFKTILAISQWQWALEQKEASHHLFLTDDLHLAPSFWSILNAMVEANPNRIIGLLSNHPAGPELAANGGRAYRCNSWIVGPAYVIPRKHLTPFLTWYRGLRDDEAPGGRRWFNDDSALNEWNTLHGPAESWHPLPTIIEHRADLESTVGHGDRYSRERVSWRAVRSVRDDGERLYWRTDDTDFDCETLASPEFWREAGPMLSTELPE